MRLYLIDYIISNSIKFFSGNYILIKEFLFIKNKTEKIKWFNNREFNIEFCCFI